MNSCINTISTFPGCYSILKFYTQSTIKALLQRFRNLIFFFILIILILLYGSCTPSKKFSSLKPSNKNIRPIGRVLLKKNGPAEIYWPGSGFSIKFRGTGLEAILKDEKGFNYFNVIIDDSLSHFIRINKAKSNYTIASNLADTIHTIKLLKRADWFRGKTWLYEFQFSSGTKIYADKPNTRMIEFYGNSITVGAAVEDNGQDNGDSIFTNNYYSYAYLTAKHFNAEYSCIASSGIGVMASAGNLIMPDIYDRLNPDDNLSKWDFSKMKSDIVVINLFQNDSWIIYSPDFIQFKRRFGTKPPTEEYIVNAYKNFVQSIRLHYPNTNIICTLGSMDAVKPGSPWPGYIEKAVAQMNDKKIFVHFFEYLNKTTHPKINDQQKMANDLIDFISNNIHW